MRIPMIVLVAFAAVVLAQGSPAASSSCGSALTLALQKADVPSTVQGSLFGPAKPHCKTADALRFIGTGLKGADYSYTWPVSGSTEKDWHLTGDVFVALNAPAAKKLFADGKAAQHGFFADFGTEKAKPLTGLHYGDEQLGWVGPDAGGPQAMVFVRRGAVVWELRIGHSPPAWKVTKAQVLTMLNTYAAKQKKRVGAG